MISNNKIKSYGNAIINCKTIDGDVILIKEKLFRQSKTLDTMFLTCELEEKEIDLELPFSTDIVLKVIKWFENHLDLPANIQIQTDPKTYERIWFELNGFEREFFEVSVDELVNLLNASNYLDINLMYMYGCQCFATKLKDKSPKEIRQMMHIKPDLTPEEEDCIRRENLWCIEH